MLEIAHEVVLTTVISHQPLTHKYTCSQVQIDLSCDNPCCSQEKQSSAEHVLVEYCDDLIAKGNNNLKQEVEQEFAVLKCSILAYRCLLYHMWRAHILITLNP